MKVNSPSRSKNEIKNTLRIGKAQEQITERQIRRIIFKLYHVSMISVSTKPPMKKKSFQNGVLNKLAVNQQKI